MKTFFKSAFRKATAGDINAPLSKVTMFKRPFRLGERAIHKASKVPGVIYALDYVNGIETVSIRTNGGVCLRNLARAEFALCSTNLSYTPESRADSDRVALNYLHCLNSNIEYVEEPSLLTEII